jgi:hypothetical protein
MTQKNILPTTGPQETFVAYLWHNSRNRITLLLALAAIIVQFSVFKYFYPFASYIHGDSFSYLDTAYWNLDINTYMVGYSRFLRLFSVFSRSDMVLTAFQYLLLQGSGLFFLFTLFYFYRPGKVMQTILLVFMVLNPLFLHMANLISSDCFFLALSLTWFALLLWILHRPNTRVVIWHTIVLFVAFTVRYNALIYPAIAMIVFLFSRISTIRKIVGIGTVFLLCGLFVLYTGNKYKKITGTWQYSPFSGWLWSNNAMYTYRFVDSAQRKPVAKRFLVLNEMVCAYIDTTRDVRKHPEQRLIASTVYMWSWNSPLYKYRERLFLKDTAAEELKRWATMGPIYKDYGVYIIRKYPWQYIRYFILPNAVKYYSPPLEFLETYNSSRDDVSEIAQIWFNYKTPKIYARGNDIHATTLIFYPILAGTMNVVFLCDLVCFIILKGFRQDTLFRKGILLATVIWLLNAGFTIFASSAALRFQAFPVILVTTFALLLIDWLCQLALYPATGSYKDYYLSTL